MVLLYFVVGQTIPYFAEVILGALAVLDLFIIFALRQPDPETDSPVDQPPPTPPIDFRLRPLEETSDNLENTRYQ
jgi:hypothetical protein